MSPSCSCSQICNNFDHSYMFQNSQRVYSSGYREVVLIFPSFLFIPSIPDCQNGTNYWFIMNIWPSIKRHTNLPVRSLQYFDFSFSNISSKTTDDHWNLEGGTYPGFNISIAFRTSLSSIDLKLQFVAKIALVNCLANSFFLSWFVLTTNDLKT